MVEARVIRKALPKGMTSNPALQKSRVMSRFMGGRPTYREGNAGAKALRWGAGWDPGIKGPELLEPH